MKKSRILATVCLIGLPLIVLFAVSQSVFSADTGDAIYEKPDSVSQEALAAPTTCGTEKIKEVLAPASVITPSVVIDCHLNLKRIDVVTKRLDFAVVLPPVVLPPVLLSTAIPQHSMAAREPLTSNKA